MSYTNRRPFLSASGFGADPAVPAIPVPPGVPKPDIPGYKTDEQCQAMLADQKAAIDEDMKMKHIMLGVGGLVIGWGIGFFVGKSGKRY